MKTFEDGKFAGCEPRDIATEDLGWIRRTSYYFADRELAAREIERRARIRELQHRA